MTSRVTIRLPEELKARAMRIAADEGRTLNAVIEEALRALIAEREAAAAPRVMPRVSKAKGWFAPGVTSLRDIEELEDAEYVDKLLGL